MIFIYIYLPCMDRMEQVQLWGILLTIITALSLLMWWCRTDEACCDVENPCLYKFGCKKHKDDESIPDDE